MPGILVPIQQATGIREDLLIHDKLRLVSPRFWSDLNHGTRYGQAEQWPKARWACLTLSYIRKAPLVTHDSPWN